MAPTSLNFPSPSPRSPPMTSTRRHIVRPISAMTTQLPPSQTKPPTKLPVRKIPGDYGLPIIGPIKDRLDYFYNQGRDEFFKSRIQKHQSTVFKTNMPPGPLISSDPNVVALLDGKSFPALFDVSKVEKRDLFTGTYMPSTKLTGGYRILSYLDPSEPMHAKLKQLLFSLLKMRRENIIPEFHASYTKLFDTVETELASKGKASFGDANDQAAFNFLAKALYGVNPAETKLGSDGPNLITIWVFFQLGPILTVGLPKVIEEIFLHTFSIPPFLIKRDYKRLYEFFHESSGSILDEAEKMGISREEACHNLLFATCFNSFGGMKIFFPSVIKWVGQSGVQVHEELATEIRSAIKSNGGEVTMAAMEQMPLMKSVVYESLRIDPPVPFQYGKAKKDFTVESHDAVFEVKKGDMLFGYQPFATKDPVIFERPEEFFPGRFLGEEGERLLRHVLWSNGPETESPTVGNKQCAGKDFVVMVSRLLVVEFFRRYDSFEVEVGTSASGSSVNLTALKKATY
ncbi:hypothetical protein RHMOL_Rhmol07G0298700 [Rhododendron molle]|uniref:Uncharacterized protein n=1 Tax=Rhododendron molle TaxID=49168 RepID=A0ACC0N6P9_RHOML|nr:hypothetical protein RHMOL_Rhmol07G0298700 [Rhododendron molle]